MSLSGFHSKGPIFPSKTIVPEGVFSSCHLQPHRSHLSPLDPRAKWIYCVWGVHLSWFPGRSNHPKSPLPPSLTLFLTLWWSHGLDCEMRTGDSYKQKRNNHSGHPSPTLDRITFGVVLYALWLGGWKVSKMMLPLYENWEIKDLSDEASIGANVLRGERERVTNGVVFNSVLCHKHAEAAALKVVSDVLHIHMNEMFSFPLNRNFLLPLVLLFGGLFCFSQMSNADDGGTCRQGGGVGATTPSFFHSRHPDNRYRLTGSL